MAESLLLKSQRNEIFRAIERAGLPIAEFRWEEVGSEFTSALVVSRLVHVPTGYFYRFDFRLNGHKCEFSPAKDTTRSEAFPGGWGDSSPYILEWLFALKREISEPNLWDTVALERDFVEAASANGESSESAFTAAERERVSEGLRELKTFLFQTEVLAEEHRRFIEVRLTYLEAATSRMGRKDWLNLAIGVFTTIVLEHVLDPSAARELFRMAGTLFQWVFPVRLIP